MNDGNRSIEKSKVIVPHKQSTAIEWRIVENDREWAQLCQPATPAVQTPRYLRRWMGEVLLLMVVLGGIGGWQWYATQAEWQQIASELAAAVQQEVAGVDPTWPATAPAQRFDLAQAELAQGTPTIRLRALQGDQAVVTVLTPTMAQVPAYRQTQFYHRTTAGWQQTAPDVTLWGLPQALETASFRWRYQVNDAEVVAAVAPQLETLYTTMRHNFGLAYVPPSNKLALEVSITQPAGYVSPWFGVADAYVVTSPALYRAPMEMTDAELLAQSLALPLLNTVIAQAREHHRVHAGWQPLLTGVRLWQLWELELPLSSWRQEVVKWLYGELARTDLGRRVVLPAHYAELCAAHTLWLPSPLQINIPLACTDLDQRGYFATPDRHRLKLHLTYLGSSTFGWYSKTSVERVDQRGQTVLLATLIEYAMTTYGRERLPILIAALHQHKNWEALLPAVYGVSVAEFEAGWHMYLLTHYGQ